MTTRYPHLLSALDLGSLQLANRVVMPSMHTRLETLDHSVERRIAFYTARARGGVGLIVTAGYSPNQEGRLEEDAQVFESAGQIPEHLPVTRAVRDAGAAMLLQILHAGRYAKHDQLVAPSPLRSPINRRTPRELSEADIERTLGDYLRTSELAREAGYAGIEIMGSEGYLITQFTAPRSNQRQDCWGGSLENRCRFAVEIVKRIRARLGDDFIIGYRISTLDLVEDGLVGEDINHLARAIEAAGANMLVTGIGWHESPVPTIAYQVPRAAWSFTAARLKRVVGIPVVATNRINTPEVAEALLARGDADLVALARPLLADPAFVAKALADDAVAIAPCIACNQACLDYIFAERAATCLVNPGAGREVEFAAMPSGKQKSIAVVGAGPGGLAAASVAAEHGHRVVLFESANEIGGQLNLAKRIPGKREFLELLRYFRVRLNRAGVTLRLGERADAPVLAAGQFDHVIVATGAIARRPAIAGIDLPLVAGYRDIIEGRRVAGRRVAIIGTGGIAHDVAEFLLETNLDQTAGEFMDEWGVDAAITVAGGLRSASRPQVGREVTLLQRGEGRPGVRLGMTTGWILRSRLKARDVGFVTGCRYDHIDAGGLHYRAGGESHCARVDTIIVCAGQEKDDSLSDELKRAGIACTAIGGARLAAELDATRAIDEGTRLACSL
ncbi:MAG: NADPH-dependent 2,4-dienoyl-CoA reductase [Steroidobacteraceae bacterium]